MWGAALVLGLSLAAGAGAAGGTGPPVAGVEPVAASYVPYKLHELVLESDLVVSGRIVALDEVDFSLQVESTLLGEVAPGLLRVQRFEDWACASRWTPYAVDQRVLLFLRQRSGKSAQILSAGGEGEMPMDHDTVRLRTGALPWGAHRGSHGSPLDTTVRLSELAAAVQGLRREVAWKVDPELVGLARAEPRISLRSLEQFAESSRVARALAAGVRSQRNWVGPRSMPGNRLLPEALRTLRIPGSAGEELGAPEPGGLAVLGDLDGDGNADLVQLHRGGLRVLCLDQRNQIRAERELLGPSTPLPPGLGSDLTRATGLVPVDDPEGDGELEVVLRASQGAAAARPADPSWLLHFSPGGRLEGAKELRIDVALSNGLRAEDVERGSAPAGRSGSPAIACVVLCAAAEGAPAPAEEGIAVVAALDSRGVVRSLRRFAGTSGRLVHAEVGQSLALLGDLDGDGRSECAYGLPGATPWTSAGQQVGAVAIGFSDADQERAGTELITASLGQFLGDLVAGGEEFGRSLCAPGDVDGDGVPDLLVGSRTGVWTLFLARDGGVLRHQKLEDSPADSGHGLHFGDFLLALPRRSADAPIPILCGGTRGKGASREAVVWQLTLGRDGVLREG